MDVAFLGPAGTLSERAARAAVAGGHARGKLRPFDAITTALDAVEVGDVDTAVVPLEDAVAGGVRETIDHLVHRAQVASVHAKVVVAAELRLATLPGATLAQATTVVSHPHALAQAVRTAHRAGLTEQRHATSTVAAAREVAAAGDPALVALCAPDAARDAGLEVTDLGTDGPDDHVAFAVVGRRTPVHHDRGRVLLFAVPSRNRPGSAHALLGAFAVRSLNLTRIESRPLTRVLGEYGFLLEVEGGLADEDVVAALHELVEEGATAKLLGAYPAPERRWGRVDERPLPGRVAHRPAELADLLDQIVVDGRR